MGTPRVTAGGYGLLGHGLGPRMRWMDCQADFGPLQLDFTRRSIHCIFGLHPHPRRPSPPAVTPGAPIRPPKGRKTPPKSTVFPWQGFTQLKSSRSNPKFARQSNHCILGPHLHPRRPYPPARTPGNPIRPQKDGKRPQINRFPLARFHAVKVKS